MSHPHLLTTYSTNTAIPPPTSTCDSIACTWQYLPSLYCTSADRNACYCLFRNTCVAVSCLRCDMIISVLFRDVKCRFPQLENNRMSVPSRCSQRCHISTSKWRDSNRKPIVTVVLPYPYPFTIHDNPIVRNAM